MKKITLILSGVLIIISNVLLYANEPSFFQLLFIIRQIFPEDKKVAIFISKEHYETAKENLSRASAQFQFKSTAYFIENSRMIGQSIKKLPKNGILIIKSSDLMMQNSNKLYILSKCKEKQISIFTTSRDYSNSGALFGVINKDDSNKLDLVLNLKHNEHLKSKFTAELIKKIGIKEVIQ